MTVLTTNATHGTSVEERNGVRIIKAGRLLDLASTPLSLALLRAARTLQADLVNLHMPYPVGDLAALAMGEVPLVLTYHSDVVRQRRLLRFYQPLLDRTLRRARRIIATSQSYVESSLFLRRYAGKCRIVPLSVDAASFATASPEVVRTLRRRFGLSVEDRVILAVGVLRYYKGLHVLLDALIQLNTTLIIVGTGPEEQWLRDLAQAYGLARHVHFARWVTDEELPTYYHAADVFVLPSHLRAEAFGTVLLEAMAAGLAVVSTELGTGTSEVNQHGVTGFVVPPGDPHALARALQVLLANDNLRQQLGTHGQQRVFKEYTRARMLDRTLAVYAEALAETG